MKLGWTLNEVKGERWTKEFLLKQNTRYSRPILMQEDSDFWREVDKGVSAKTNITR
jgi:hypothetical protein